MDSSFGFEIKEWPDGSVTVSLPHECDRWRIAGDEFDGGTTPAKAVIELRRFIAEAESVLAELSIRARNA